MTLPSARISQSGPAVQGSAIAWLNLIFLCSVHLAAAIGLICYLMSGKLEVRHLLLCLLGTATTTFVISIGYHRLFSHRSYETGAVLRGAFLLLGAGAFQNSALEWASKHRRHHRCMDSNEDPYDATRGFWYSHMGWVIQQGAAEDLSAADLQRDPLVRWQHRHYLWLASGSGLLLPLLIGFLLGDALGGLVFGGLCRLVVSYHMTFSINSVAHWIGGQPYSGRGSARDSWITAMLTMGEGYHNYHHTFPRDYRNGVRFFDFDPPKWALAGLARLGLVHNLARTPGHLVALRRLRRDRRALRRCRFARVHQERLEQQLGALRSQLGEWARTARTVTGPAGRIDLVLKRRAFWRNYRAWKLQLRWAELD